MLKRCRCGAVALQHPLDEGHLTECHHLTSILILALHAEHQHGRAIHAPCGQRVRLPQCVYTLCGRLQVRSRLHLHSQGTASSETSSVWTKALPAAALELFKHVCRVRAVKGIAYNMTHVFLCACTRRHMFNRHASLDQPISPCKARVHTSPCLDLEESPGAHLV